MTLEVLFAKAGQSRAFLLMVLLGAALALGVQLAGLLHRRNAWLGHGADLLCAAGLALGLGQILLDSGEGLRLYGLLGLCIGGALGTVCTRPVVSRLALPASSNTNGKD